MNQQNQHTPTPWGYSSLPALSEDWFSIADADGTEVARIPHVVGESPAGTRQRAAHIVHCVNSHASLVADNKRLTETNGVLVKALKMQDTDIPYSRKLEWVYRGLKAAGRDMPPIKEIHAMQREDVLLRVIQWASEAVESERARVGANPEADTLVPSWLPELEAAIAEVSK